MARAAMNWRALALLAALTVAPAVSAKGIFQAEGVISDVQRRDNEVTFRFAGTISFGYATAPNANPTRQWKDVNFVVTDIPVQVSGWTSVRNPGVSAEAAEIDRICSKLAELAKSGRRVRFSLDNPMLSFSNVGELVRASGTYVYAVESEQ
jgi:hypothetical protein